VRLFEAKKHPSRRFCDVKGKPGEIAAIGERSVEIVVQGGSLEITRMRAEDGPKSFAADLVKSLGLSAGSSLEQ
jgi:methionyl-tRNA formyltransferase